MVRIIHSNGSFDCLENRSLKNDLQEKPQRYSVVNLDGEVLMVMPTYVRFIFRPKDKVFIINLESQEKKFYRLNSRYIFKEVKHSSPIDPNELDAEEKLLYAISLV